MNINKLLQKPLLAYHQFRAALPMMGRVLVNEVWKVLYIQWGYQFQLWTMLFGEAIGFLGAVFLVGVGQPSPELIINSALGYILTYYARQIVTEFVMSIRMETSTGTLEQVYMTIMPVDIIMLGNMIAVFFASTVRLFIILIGLWWFIGLTIPFQIGGVFVVLITLVGLAGAAYMAGGFLFVFRQTSALVNIVGVLLSFVNGTYLTLDQLPANYAFFARLLPTTEGIIIFRQVMLGEASFPSLFWSGGLTYLIVHSIGWFIVGRLVFLWGEHQARLSGALGQH